MGEDVSCRVSQHAASGSQQVTCEAAVQFNLEVPELLEAQQSLDTLKKDLSKPVVLEVRQVG